jgi:hypothetical protein
MAQRVWFALGLFAIIWAHQCSGEAQIDDYLAGPEPLVAAPGGYNASYEAWFHQCHAVLHG